jgi:hypothetical protein
LASQVCEEKKNHPVWLRKFAKSGEGVENIFKKANIFLLPLA